MLPPGTGWPSSSGDHIPRLGDVAVAVHRLSHLLGPVIAMVAWLAGLCALGIADCAAVRNRCLDYLSTHADAGHCGDVVEQGEERMRFLNLRPLVTCQLLVFF